MVNGRTSEAIRYLSRVFQEGTLAGLPDGEILDRFVERRDEAAFELLLRRHGPMVLNVCRQVLFDPHEVEDAFQATFLVLVCKASSIRVEGSLGPWLYRVAGRISARARANLRRRKEREVSPEEHPEPSVIDDPDGAEIPRVVQEEMGRLPERLRAPLVLCYLEGMTHELAARELRCPVGTVRSRLARGRALLQKRIARRGLVSPAAALSAVLESTSRASAVPPHLPRSLITLANRFTAGSASIGGGVGVSASVAALLEGVLIVMRVKKLASLAAMLLVGGTLAAVVGMSAWPAAGQTGGGPDPRVRGLDGKALQSVYDPGPVTHVKTYYVGDIVTPPTPRPGGPPAPAKDGKFNTNQMMVDIKPLVDLITSTVARGSWTIHDGQGKDITSEYRLNGGGKAGGPSRPTGQITPFFLSISLIIRCTPEVHEEVANLLRGLRRLQDARDNPGVDMEEEEAKLGLPPHPADSKPAATQTIVGQAVHSSVHSSYLVNPISDASNAPEPADPRPSAGRAIDPASHEKRARIQQLLDALRREVEALPKDQD